MPDTPQLPFTIAARHTGRESVNFIAAIDGQEIACEKYSLGSGRDRNRVGLLWSQDERLRNGTLVSQQSVVAELERKELLVKSQIDDSMDGEDGDEDLPCIECASFVDNNIIAEMAWNYDIGRPDFIVYDRESNEITRKQIIHKDEYAITIPKCWKGICTPGGYIKGMILIPSNTRTIAEGVDYEVILRSKIKNFINRYVELPSGADDLCTEYVLFSWVHDNFDELPYLAFRTADFGRGKSRALETIGSLCYLPSFCGGGSSAAATLRLLDIFGGTLLADEFDQQQQSELASELNRIVNLGFQKNRPLVKCDGEKNQPRPFQCFGPKIFALRKRFGDDASESRMISITMKRRTRKNIPINLPREEFSREAEQIRNDLLSWRFNNYNNFKLIPIDDTRLEDRYRQIGSPLASISKSTDTRSLIITALLKQQGDVAIDSGDSWAGEVFHTIIGLFEAGDILYPGDIAAAINRQRATDEGVEIDRLRNKITAKGVGKAIRIELELPSCGRDSRGMKYKLDPKRLDDLVHRFGVSSHVCTQSTHVHSETEVHTENTLFDSENDDCVHSVENVLTTEGVCTLDEDSTSATDCDTIPDGWTRSAWINRLEQLANTCEADHPDKALEYRNQATKLGLSRGVK